MQPLPHFDGTPRLIGKVARIVKNIFETPHAPRTSTEGLRRHVIANGYTQLSVDRNMYVKRNGGDLLIMASTIDDFSVATNSKKFYQELSQALATSTGLRTWE